MNKRTKKGFTLIELMVAMGIIAVLVTMSVVGIQLVQQSLRNTQRTKALEDINIFISGYFNRDLSYPTSLYATTDEIRVNGATGEVVVELTGANKKGATTTSSSTQYCYGTDGASGYIIGVTLEGSTGFRMLGNNLDLTCSEI